MPAPLPPDVREAIIAALTAALVADYRAHEASEPATDERSAVRLCTAVATEDEISKTASA
jgi:hypothetical protein